MKAVAGVLADPLMVAWLIAAAAAIGRLLKRPTICRVLLVCAATVGYLGSTSLVGDALLGSLEHRFPQLRHDQPLPRVCCVVVLGSGYRPHDGIPLTAALDADGLVRIVEGITLVRRLGAARLVVSGGAPPGGVPPARGYAQLAHALGVGDASLVVLDSALDTAAEARAVGQLLGKEPFILVTSAYHMPRAVRQMERAGAQPIAAPTGQLAVPPGSGGWVRWLPTSGGLGKNERALHEYLGLAAMAIGQ